MKTKTYERNYVEMRACKLLFTATREQPVEEGFVTYHVYQMPDMEPICSERDRFVDDDQMVTRLACFVKTYW